MAAFASKASRSNCNVVSSERIADGLRKLVSCFVVDLRPLIDRDRGPLLDDDTHAFVIANTVQWRHQLQDVFRSEIFSLNDLAHLPITIIPERSISAVSIGAARPESRIVKTFSSS